MCIYIYIYIYIYQRSVIALSSLLLLVAHEGATPSHHLIHRRGLLIGLGSGCSRLRLLKGRRGVRQRQRALLLQVPALLGGEEAQVRVDHAVHAPTRLVVEVGCELGVRHYVVDRLHLQTAVLY